jgi:hypothetical protein
MSRTKRLLMLKVVKTKKVKPSGSGKDTMERTRDGEFYTLLIKVPKELQEKTRTSASTSMSHSLLFLECQ